MNPWTEGTIPSSSYEWPPFPFQQKATTPGEWALSREATVTSTGHHFIQAYNANKWAFYLEHVLGIRPKTAPPALLFGQAIHSAIEFAYTVEGGDRQITEAFEAIHDEQRPLYENQADWHTNRERGGPMLQKWIDRFWQRDLLDFDLLVIEQAFEFKIANGQTISMRPDKIVRSKATGALFIADYKTSGYSATKPGEAYALQDQNTLYLLGLSKFTGEHLGGAFVEILYRKGSVTEATRPLIVHRSPRELNEHEFELIGLFEELAEKVAKLKAGYPALSLFPRNGKDEAYFGNSPYSRIYRADLGGMTYPEHLEYELPVEFERKDKGELWIWK